MSGVTLEAARLVHCVHGPAERRRVVTHAPAKWCKRCGAVFNGAGWERPDLHAVIRDAVHAASKLRLGREKAAAKREHAKRAAAKKSASPRKGAPRR